MRYIAALSLALLGLFLGHNARAQIPNDQIDRAIEISMKERIARVEGRIVGADVDLETPTFGLPTVWYKFVPPISGKIFSQIQGIGYFMWATAITGDLETDTYTVVAEAGVSTSYNNSGTSINTDNYDVVGGTTYYIGVIRGSQLDARGRGNFDFSYIHVFTAGQISDTFAARTPIGGSKASIRLNLGSLTTEADEPPHSTSAMAPAGKTGWLTITKPIRTLIKLNAKSTTFEPLIAVYSGNALTALTRVAQSTAGGSVKERSATLSFVAEANVPYAIAFDGNANRAGVFTLEFETSAVTPGFIVRPQPQIVQEGASFIMTATVAATGDPVYQWQSRPPGSKTWINLVDDATHAGVTTNILTVSNILLEADGTQYRVRVSDVVGATTSPSALVNVTEFAPATTEVLGNLSIDISNTRLVDDLEGVTFYATGLPRGLVINPATGIISGKVASTVRPGVYRVTYGTIKDGKRSAGKLIRLIEVSPFAPTLTGAFEGLFLDGSSLPIGKLNLRVSTRGDFTGSYFHLALGRTIPIRGSLELNQTDRTAGTPVDSPVTISLGRGLPTYTLEFTLSKPSGADPNQFGSLVAYLKDDTIALVGQTLDGRAVSRATTANPALWAGAYTLVFSEPALVGGAPTVAVPLGSGHATGTISALGALSLRGRLPDNTQFTGTLASSTDADYLIAQRHRSVGGNLSGSISLESQISFDLTSTQYHAASASNSTLYWTKPVSPRDALYPDGFGAFPVRFITLMQPWAKSPGQIATKLGLASSGEMKINIVANISQDSNDALTSRGNVYGLPIDVLLSQTGRLSYVDPAQNATKFALAINSNTGTYTGTYELSEPIVPPATKSAKIRRVTFSGVLLQLASPFQGDVIGSGFAIVPPFDATEKTTSALIDFRAGSSDSPFAESPNP